MKDPRVINRDPDFLVGMESGTPVLVPFSSSNTAPVTAPGPVSAVRLIALTAAQIASPTAAMLADTSAMYVLNVAPYTRHYSDGSTSPLPALGSGGGGASLTNITAAALAALNSGTASATTQYRVTDGSYRDTVYLYDTTSDTFHPIGIPPSAFGFA